MRRLAVRRSTGFHRRNAAGYCGTQPRHLFSSRLEPLKVLAKQFRTHSANKQVSVRPNIVKLFLSCGPALAMSDHAESFFVRRFRSFRLTRALSNVLLESQAATPCCCRAVYYLQFVMYRTKKRPLLFWHYS